jgi:Na+-transporting methylmalonyl-CoA/oxaloacetate decarboxylase gamma subunit
MNDSLTTTLFVTLIGMVVVFLAMALIYASMRILTLATSDISKSSTIAGTETPQADAQANDKIKTSELRAVAVAVAVARAEAMSGLTAISEPQMGGNTAWGEFYRHRQLRPGGRGRAA